MSYEEFVHVLDQIKAYTSKTGEPIPCVDIHGNGEPLLWPHFKEGILACADYGLNTQLITNGLLLDEETAEFILRNITQKLKVSVNAATPETLAKVAKCAHPERVIANCRALGEKLKEGRHTVKNVYFGFVRCAENSHEAQQFLEMWEPFTDVLRLNVVDDIGPVAAAPSPDTTGTCPRLAPAHMSVLNNGNVNPCCRTTEIVLGNIFTTSLEDMINGDEYQRMLQLNRENRLGEISVCNRSCLAGKRASRSEL